MLKKQEILWGKGTPAESSRLREPRTALSPRLAVSGFTLMGLVYRLSLGSHSDSRVLPDGAALYSQDECQREGFWEVVRHVVSHFDLS